MDYQLVLQFRDPSDSLQEALTSLEDDFVETLEDSADVEGHEGDSESLNIFVSTGNPKKTFERLRSVLTERQLLDGVIAAYRHVDDDEYKVLWPKEPPAPFRAP